MARTGFLITFKTTAGGLPGDGEAPGPPRVPGRAPKAAGQARGMSPQPGGQERATRRASVTLGFQGSSVRNVFEVTHATYGDAHFTKKQASRDEGKV